MKYLILLLFFVSSLNAQEYSLELQDLDPSKVEMGFKEYSQETALFCIQLSNLVYLELGEIDTKINLLRLMYPEQDIRYMYLREDNYDYPLSDKQVGKRNKLRINKARKKRRRKRTSTELMFFGTKDFVFIVYRGSDSFRDWKTNFRLSKRKLVEEHNHDGEYRGIPSGHRGYRDALKNLMDNQDVFGRLKEFVGQYTTDVSHFPIYTTGHSLGGGLAILMIKPLQYKNEFNYQGSYTFAPALAISKSDVHLFENEKDKIFNIINYADIVARKNYAYLVHIGHCFRFSKYDPVRHPEDDGVLFYEKKIKPINFTRGERFSFFNTVLKYHRLDRYIERIKLPINSTKLVKERIIVKQVKGD